jgi:hypothetical protein
MEDEPLSDGELIEDARLIDAASPGPWEAFVEEQSRSELQLYPDGRLR